MTEAPKTPTNETSENELDAHSLDAIRSILTEEEKPAPRPVPKRAKAVKVEAEPEVAPVRSKADAFPPLESPEVQEVEDLRPETAKRRWFSLRRTPKSRAPKPAAPATRRAAPKMVNDNPDSLLARLKAYRPKPAHIALAALVLLVVLRPWLVFGLIFLSIIILVGVFLIAGYDGFWQGAIKLGRWYANRRPERAAKLHARLDRFAVKWDAVLDRFPEGTVDGLYLPDFGELATADARHSEAMERRLTGIHGSGA